MDGDKKDGSNFSVNLPVILLLLAAAGNLFWTQSPLVTWRPSEPASQALEPIRDQMVRARLWEDPFSVLQERTNSHRVWENELSNEVHGHSNMVEVLPVMVPGGPYADDREWRVRCRFAVLSALSTSGFVPEDSEHLGWWKYDRHYSDNRGDHRLTNNIPFEWFTKTPNNDRTKEETVLVLWLREDLFEEMPLTSIGDMLAKLQLPTSVRVGLIGPQESTTLRNMWDNELSSGKTNVTATIQNFYRTNKTEIYSASATLADWRLFRHEPGTNLFDARAPIRNELRSNYNIGFHNGICTDDQTAAMLVQELSCRGIDWHKPYHIALISEWDSVYGRSLPQSFTNAIANARRDYWVRQPDPGIVQFSYLKGLDGQTTAESKSQTRGKEGLGDSQKDQEKQREQNLSDLQKPEGNSQLDYIPRLALQLREKEGNWTKKDRFDAIGILGSDVYDKLLLLQSLRQHFPDAIFFTTDLDARLFHASQLRWTRNLIVASSFGLRLNDELQGTITPFRDSYQTAQYLACLNALGKNCELTNDDIPRCFEIGRRGPVDLSDSPGTVHPMPRVKLALPWPDIRRILARVALMFVLAWAFALAIYPQTRKVLGVYFEDEVRGNVIIVGVCAFALASAIWHPALLVATGAVYWGSVVVRGDRKDRLWKRPFPKSAVVLTIAVGILILVLYVIIGLIADDNSNPAGQPFSFYDGISVWPSEIVRIFAILLSIGFLVKARFNWHCEVAQTTKAFQLSKVDAINEQWRQLFDPILWREKISVASWNVPKPEGEQKIDGEKLWREYIERGYQPFRYARAIRTAFVAILFAISLSSLFPSPIVPHRGPLAGKLDFAIIFLSAWALLILTFYVTDATHLCAKFIENLTGTETKWLKVSNSGPAPDLRPATSATTSSAPLSAPEIAGMAYVKDIRLIAARTESLGKMIYYPFIIILLLFVARNAIFAAWHWTLFLYIIFALNVAYACIAAFWLRRVAETAREDALQALRDRLLEALAEKRSLKTTEFLKSCISEVENKRDGAFAPLFQQPIFKAVLMPFGGAGLITALQYLLGQ